MWNDINTKTETVIFALPREGVEGPSPKINEFLDVFRLSKFPPILRKVFFPRQLRWAPVSIRKFVFLGPLLWKLV